MEDIDHAIRNFVFECLCNSSISSTSHSKSMASSYVHADVIYIVGTTIITINIKGGLIKTHVEFMKKGPMLSTSLQKRFERGVQSSY